MSELRDESGAPGHDLTQPNPAFTIPAARLQGSPACLNCGTGLQGPFCHYCGQPDRNFLRFFPALLRELASDFLDFDSRFMRTMKPLLFHPGRLTRDFLDGRRYRYTPPLRLYLFASIVFFLVAAMLSAGAVHFSTDGEEGVISTGMTDAEREALEKAIADLPAELQEQVRSNAPSDGDVRMDANGLQIGNIQFNDKPWDRDSNPLVVPFMPDRLNDWINDELADSPRKVEEINANPNVIIDKVFDLLPGTMFLLLPVVALIFKFWYLFARRYYIEHLIFALHNHAFIFVTLLMAFLAGVLGDFLDGRGIEGASRVLGWLRIGLFAWIPLYLLVSLRVVYRQNWFLTLFKYSVIGVSYVVLLGLVTSFIAMLSFLLL